MTTTRDCKVRSGEVENNDKILHVCRGQQDLVLGATVHKMRSLRPVLSILPS